MSVRVNLLPREIEERRAARRVTGLSVAGVVVFLALLGLLYVVKLGQVRDAEEEREVVRGQVVELEGQIAELEEFRVLAEELEARNALLASAMDGEVSYARVLNDLALAFPTSSSLRTLSGQLLEADRTPIGAAEAAVMEMSFNGYSVERYAPGVETIILEFDRVSTFFAPFVSQAQQEDVEATEVTGFTGSVQLNEEAFTGRYREGLPGGVPQ